MGIVSAVLPDNRTHQPPGTVSMLFHKVPVLQVPRAWRRAPFDLYLDVELRPASNGTVARCTVERLMRDLGIKGVLRGKKIVTTNPDTSQPCPDDKVNRLFMGDRPNKLWVSDFTYVQTWSGTVYVAFVIDVFARRIVGWRASTSMKT